MRVVTLGSQELRGDEAFGFFFQQRSFEAIISDTIALDEPHPVASYFVQKPWLAIAGGSEFSLRFSSLLFSVLAVALLVPLSHRLSLARSTTLLGALLLAASPYAIWHAQDARMYSMSLALNTALIWLALEALARRRWQYIAAYIATAWLALHTHYFTFFVLAGLTLFVVGRALVSRPARRAVIDWLTWNFILALVYLPWLAQSGAILGDYGGNGDSPALADALTRSLGLFAVGESSPPSHRLAWALMVSALFVVGALRLYFNGPIYRRTLWLLVCCLATPVLLTWAGSIQRPIFNERYLVAAAPAAYLLAASAIEPCKRLRSTIWLAVPLLVVLFAGMVVSLYRQASDPAYSKTRGWRELAATMSVLASDLPAEQVRYVQTFPDPTLWYYTGPVDHIVLPPLANDADSAQQEVLRLGESPVARVIVAHQPSASWDPGEIASNALAEIFPAVFSQELGPWTVLVHDRASGSDITPNARFERGIVLEDTAWAPGAPGPGDLLALHIDWTADGSQLSGSEAVSVQVIGPDGRLAAQSDAPFPSPGPSGAVSSAYGILLPEMLTPGDYRLQVAIYEPTEPGAPRLLVNGADYLELAHWPLP